MSGFDPDAFRAERRRGERDMTDRCFYCDRASQVLEVCCDRHPGDLVCADRAGCRDFILAALRQ